jgi:hypothetical protein
VLIALGIILVCTCGFAISRNATPTITKEQTAPMKPIPDVIIADRCYTHEKTADDMWHQSVRKVSLFSVNHVDKQKVMDILRKHRFDVRDEETIAERVLAKSHHYARGECFTIHGSHVPFTKLVIGSNGYTVEWDKETRDSHDELLNYCRDSDVVEDLVGFIHWNR